VTRQPCLPDVVIISPAKCVSPHPPLPSASCPGLPPLCRACSTSTASSAAACHYPLSLSVCALTDSVPRPLSPRRQVEQDLQRQRGRERRPEGHPRRPPADHRQGVPLIPRPRAQAQKIHMCTHMRTSRFPLHLLYVKTRLRHLQTDPRPSLRCSTGSMKMAPPPVERRLPTPAAVSALLRSLSLTWAPRSPLRTSALPWPARPPGVPRISCVSLSYSLPHGRRHPCSLAARCPWLCLAPWSLCTAFSLSTSL